MRSSGLSLSVLYRARAEQRLTAAQRWARGLTRWTRSLLRVRLVFLLFSQRTSSVLKAVRSMYIASGEAVQPGSGLGGSHLSRGAGGGASGGFGGSGARDGRTCSRAFDASKCPNVLC